MKRPIKSLSIEAVGQCIKDAKLPSFRSLQLLEWLYNKGADDYAQMSNLPKAMREQFEQAYPLFKPQVIDSQSSRDGSRKYVLKLHDEALAETVALPSEDGRLTVCASSQSGCSMGCVFCATGKGGLTRSLNCGEIADQVMLVQEDYRQRVTNVVVMGQGEPFANYDAVIDALHLLNHPKLFNIGARHITVSTCGIIAGIRRFAQEPEQFTLAISLHSAIQPVRDALIPAMANQPLEKLRSTLVSYSNQTGRRFSFEYALMKDLNDDKKSLEALIDYASGLLCHVNLIPLNKVDDSPIKPVPRARLEQWQHALEAAGIPASIRVSRGADIDAACGQLARKLKNS